MPLKKLKFSAEERDVEKSPKTELFLLKKTTKFAY